MILDCGCNVYPRPGALTIDLKPPCDVVCDVHNLPFREGTFDKIYLTYLIEHVNPLRTLQEIHRATRPGGLVYVETGNAMDSVLIFGSLIYGRYWVCDNHLQIFGWPELSNCLRHAGFKVLQVRHLFTPKRWKPHMSWLERLAWIFAHAFPQFRANIGIWARKT